MTCNMCHDKMRTIKGFKGVCICVNPRCPNYALLQMPVEKMPKEDEIDLPAGPKYGVSIKGLKEPKI